MCYQELANEVCGTDGVGTYNSTTHMCEGTLLKFIDIQIGFRQTCGIDSLGDTYCFGVNQSGQLGHTPETNGDMILLNVGGNIIYNTNFNKVNINTKFVQLKSHFSKSCALDNVGDWYCWGNNSSGQNGLTIKSNIVTPQKLTIITSYGKTCEDGFTLEETTGRCWQNKQ